MVIFLMLTWVYLAQNYHPILERNGVWFHEVAIKEGMTLFSIAQEVGVSSTQIKADNAGLTDQVLLGSKILVRASRATFDYLVMKGDTPFGISKKFAISIDSLSKYNPSIMEGVQFKSLLINQKLTIKQGIKRYAVGDEMPTQTPEFIAVDSNEMSYRTFDFSDTLIDYVVKTGDKLSDISKRYLISTARLKSLNALSSSTLKPGTTLKIPISQTSNQVSVNAIPSKKSPILYPKPQVLLKRRFIPKPTDKALRIGVFLPFNRDSLVFPLKGYQKFAFEFYMGMMAGIDSIKELDINGDVYFFDYQSKEEAIDLLIRSGKIDRFDLFIGPMHPIECEKLSKFSTLKGIPLVLPLPISSMSKSMESNELLFLVASEMNNQVRMLANTLATQSLSKQVILFESGLSSDTTLEHQFMLAFNDYAPNNARVVLANESMIKAFSKSTTPLNIVCLSQDKKHVINILKATQSNPNVSLYGLREWTEYKEVNAVLENQGTFNYMSTTCFDLENPSVKNFHKAFRVAYETDLTKSALLGYDLLCNFVPWFFNGVPMKKGLMTTFDYGKTVNFYHSNEGFQPCRFKNFKNERTDGWK
ncbi:MAG: LysM peptidoglycan-binding domain-containing protein [Flavobacteriales bacterium]